LKQWEERIVASFCAGVTTVRHRRKGRRGRYCEGRKGVDTERRDRTGTEFHNSIGGGNAERGCLKSDA
jgi:hypothetical protein